MTGSNSITFYKFFSLILMGGGSSKDNNLARFQSKSVLVSGIAAAIGERSVTAGGSKKLINVSGYVKAQDAQKITVFGRSEGVIASCIVGESGLGVIIWAT